MKKTLLFLLFTPFLSFAQEGSLSAAEMAKKLQDPLAHISAIMSDNDLLFNTGQNDFSFSSSIQPLKAWSFEKGGFNFIARGVIPVVGLAPQAQKPPFAGNGGVSTGVQWGLSDALAQFFFSPKTDQAWKWGIGPMFSLKTRTGSSFTGPGWGSGPVAVLVGGTDLFSFAFIGGHLWNFEGSFSTSIFQPMVYYNVPSKPGMAISYNNQISYDWQGKKDNELTIPLGISLSQTFAMAKGNGLDLGVGPYWNVVKPEGAADMMVRLNVAWMFP